MKISITTKDNSYITTGNFIDKSSLIGELKDIEVDKLKLSYGKHDVSDINGKEVLISGKEYIINKRKYDLESGYGLRAIINDKFEIIPKLRRAYGQEVNTMKDQEGNGVCAHWPIIEFITE